MRLLVSLEKREGACALFVQKSPDRNTKYHIPNACEFSTFTKLSVLFPLPHCEVTRIARVYKHAATNDTSLDLDPFNRKMTCRSLSPLTCECSIFADDSTAYTAGTDTQLTCRKLSLYFLQHSITTKRTAGSTEVNNFSLIQRQKN